VKIVVNASIVFSMNIGRNKGGLPGGFFTVEAENTGHFIGLNSFLTIFRP